MVFSFIKKLFGKKKEHKEEYTPIQNPDVNEESYYQNVGQDTDIDPESVYRYGYSETREAYQLTPSVLTCGVCGKKLSGMTLYCCYYCKNTFCKDHGLPEKHNCTNKMRY